MWRNLRDPTFSRFDTIPECDRHTNTHTDRQTDRQTDGHTTTAYTALSKASRGKNATSIYSVVVIASLARSANLPEGLYILPMFFRNFFKKFFNG